MAAKIKDLWQRLEASLGRQAPAVLDSLAAPASGATIASLEGEFGLSLPKELTQSWAIHDGQESDVETDFLFASRTLGRLEA